MDPGTVGFKGFAHTIFDRTLILGCVHINEIDNNQAAHVAQSELTSDFFSGFQIGVERGFFDVTAFGCTGRVDVYRYQRFGGINNQ